MLSTFPSNVHKVPLPETVTSTAVVSVKDKEAMPSTGQWPRVGSNGHEHGLGRITGYPDRAGKIGDYRTIPAPWAPRNS